MSEEQKSQPQLALERIYAKDLSFEIAGRTDSIVIQVIGNKITLFRQRKKDSKINLPS